jgi:membrane-bound lytic murein transglycosylase D
MRRHFPAVERALHRRGLPTDLKYVALIESALNPAAESHAGARGIWQFMPATAAEYGLDALSVTDPAASTAAAARYLAWLGRRFDGDWQLALAAYNCGVGRVERLAQAYRAETGREPTFWALRDRLPAETRAYVPRFIAVAEALGARG